MSSEEQNDHYIWRRVKGHEKPAYLRVITQKPNLLIRGLHALGYYKESFFPDYLIFGVSSIIEINPDTEKQEYEKFEINALKPGMVAILEPDTYIPYPTEHYVITFEYIDLNLMRIFGKVERPRNLPICVERWSIGNFETPNDTVVYNFEDIPSIPGFEKTHDDPETGITRYEYKLKPTTIISSSLRSNLYYVYHRHDSLKIETAPWSKVFTVVGFDELPNDQVYLNKAGSILLTKLTKADKVEIDEYMNVIYRQGASIFNDPTHAICFNTILKQQNLFDLTQNQNEKASTYLAPDKQLYNQNEANLLPEMIISPQLEKQNEIELDAVKDLLSTLRLFKAGYVELGLQFTFRQTRPNSIYTFQDKAIPYSPKDDQLNNNSFSLASEELPDLVQFIEFCFESGLLSSIENGSILARAINRFEKTYVEIDLYERITDAVIGLEALLRPGKTGEIAYSVGQRAGFLFSDDLKERNEISNFIRSKAYDIRSNLVHADSKNRKITWEDSEYCQNILRKCIRRLLTAPKNLLEEFILKRKNYDKADKFYDALIIAGNFNDGLNLWSELQAENKASEK